MTSIALIAFTRAGCELALRIANGLAELPAYAQAEFSVSGPARFAEEADIHAYTSIDDWTARRFGKDDALVFVGACGIAVRAIVPYVHDKLTDPAVVSIDERGSFALPLLSGHVGGANALARDIASVVDGQAAISTATDVNGLFAVDEWAARHGFAIVERAIAKKISARLLDGGTVGFTSDFDIDWALPEGAVAGIIARPADLGFHVTLNESASPHGRTLHLIPRIVTVGVGCRKGIATDVLERAVDDALARAGISQHAVATIASIDVKCDEPAIRELAEARGWDTKFYSAEELAGVEGEFSASEFVSQTVGVDNVCERAACAQGATLIAGKYAADGTTVALAVAAIEQPAREEGDADAATGESPAECESHGSLAVVGLGPGGASDLTGRARAALQACDLIVGYPVYVDLVRDEFPDKDVLTTPMRKEIERCQAALEQAADGRKVALVCSGDPGVYGMAGLIFELAKDYPDVPIDIIAGVSASNGGAAVLGAPLMHDYCIISLSDLLTPWESIEQRLEAAARSDFVVVLYNPSSHKRADYLARACDVLLRYKDASTVCGTVRNIGRDGEEASVLTLGELRDTPVDMFTTVFIGNSQTVEIDGRMVTPRGYLQRRRGEAGSKDEG